MSDLTNLIEMAEKNGELKENNRVNKAFLEFVNENMDFLTKEQFEKIADLLEPKTN